MTTTWDRYSVRAQEDRLVSPRRRSRRPSLATLERWMEEGGCKATDGCWVEPDGECEHGARSWLLVMGLI